MANQTTTAGALLIKRMLPTIEAQNNFDVHTPLDKKGMSKLVNNLIKHGGDNYHESINDLAKLFFNKATEIGSSTPLSDYVNDSDERQAMFSEFETKVTGVLKQNLSKQEQARALDNLSREISGKMSKHNLTYMLQRGSTAAKMANTGARGNPSQLQQGTASPLMAQDVKGTPIPVVIKHSFAEGLSGPEYLAMSYGGRASTVMSQLSTEKPGALFKRLTPAVFHEVITISDCGTHNGVSIPVSDAHACIGKYEAGTNKLVDEQRYKELVSQDTKKVMLRSTMTCEAKEGLCQKCYGIAANGRLPDIGQNMGIIAAQSVSEVLTQAMLSTKHQGGVAGRQRNPYEEASNLLNNPKDNFQDEATISKKNGKVESIKKTALNDYEVHVGGISHFIPRLQEPVVKVGESIKIGDPLSTGTINPRELTSLKGAGAGRVYLSNKMREIYSRNATLDPRHFDVIARNMIKHVEVTDPGESGFLPGDKVDVAQLAEHFRDNSVNAPIEQVQGRVLAKNLYEMTPGTILTPNHVDELKSRGVKVVPISTSGLTVKALVPGLQTNKLLDKNWISKLSFSHLSKTVQEAGALNERSAIHSIDPITPYVLGSEFGEGENGKY